MEPESTMTGYEENREEACDDPGKVAARLPGTLVFRESCLVMM